MAFNKIPDSGLPNRNRPNLELGKFDVNSKKEIVVRTASESSLKDGPMIDSFGNLRVSEKFIVLDMIPNFDKSQFHSSVSNGAGSSVVYNSTYSTYDLTCGTVSGSFAIDQSREQAIYTSGQSSIFYETAYLPAKQANQMIKMGWFNTTDTNTYDDYEGMSFEISGDTEYFCIESRNSNFTNLKIPKSSWNIDKLDGTGPSGVTIDSFEEFNIIFLCDFQYLGVGRVRFGFEIEDANGNYGPVFCHYHQFVNNSDYEGPYLQKPIKPLRWEARALDTLDSAFVFREICGSFQSEGAVKPPLAIRALPTAVINTDVDEAFEALFALRVSTSFFPGVIELKQLLISTTSVNTSGEFIVILNPTIVGGTWNSISNSIAQYNSTITSYSGGKVISGGFYFTDAVSDLPNREVAEHSGWSVAGVSGTILIAVKGDSANQTVKGQAVWEEIY